MPQSAAHSFAQPRAETPQPLPGVHVAGCPDFVLLPCGGNAVLAKFLRLLEVSSLPNHGVCGTWPDFLPADCSCWQIRRRRCLLSRGRLQGQAKLFCSPSSCCFDLFGRKLSLLTGRFAAPEYHLEPLRWTRRTCPSRSEMCSSGSWSLRCDEYPLLPT